MTRSNQGATDRSRNVSISSYIDQKKKALRKLKRMNHKKMEYIKSDMKRKKLTDLQKECNDLREVTQKVDT